MESVLDHYNYFKTIACRFLPDKNDADDLLHETMLQAMTHMYQYTPGTNIRGWLYTIMQTKFINIYRRKKLENKVIQRGYDHCDVWDKHSERRITKTIPDHSKPEVETHFEYRDTIKQINQMKSTMRECITLYMNGYQYNEIADHLEIPIGTVKSSIHFARKKLETTLL